MKSEQAVLPNPCLEEEEEEEEQEELTSLIMMVAQTALPCLCLQEVTATLVVTD